jgi:hypothetical protein
MRTIRRTATRVIATLQQELTDCRRYDAASGELVPVDPAQAWQALADFPRAQLVESTDKDKYTVLVHSNLFFQLRRG